MFDESDEKEGGPFLTEEKPAPPPKRAEKKAKTRKSKSSQKAKPGDSKPSQDVHILINDSEKTFEMILTADKLAEAGAKAVTDKSLKVYKATLLEPEVVFK